jgi:2-polyprenyl-6-methoxyphenol hydroxylase-like FAD-dependent oxidoreductase
MIEDWVVPCPLPKSDYYLSTATMTTDHRRRFRISIIGGGLGGLGLAQILRSNPRLQVMVYERSSTEQDPLAGYRIQMETAALEGLKAHTSAEVAKGIEASVGYQPVEGQLLGFMDARRKKMLASWYPPAMRTMKSVNRWLLRDALMVDTGDILTLGKKFSHYEEMEHGPVRLFFADGTHEECDLLVGADGVRSKVRQQLLPSIKVRESGIGVTYFKVPYISETEDLLPFGTGVAVREFLASQERMLLTINRLSVQTTK